MARMEPFGPEQLREMIGGPSRNRAEEFMHKARTGRSPDPRSPAGPPAGAPINEVGAHHDGAIRNNLAGLVRAFLQSGDKAKLRELLVEHRNFIDGILNLLDSQK